MTDEQIDAMKAGPEMDRLVAQAMGWLPPSHPKTKKQREKAGLEHNTYNRLWLSPSGILRLPPLVSTDWNAWGRLWEWCEKKFAAITEEYHIESLTNKHGACLTPPVFKSDNYESYESIGFGETKQEAFIIAFLKWALATGTLKGAQDETDTERC